MFQLQTHLQRKCRRPGEGSAPGGLQTALTPAPTGTSLGTGVLHEGWAPDRLTDRVHAELRWLTPSLPFEGEEHEALRGTDGQRWGLSQAPLPGRGGHRLTVTGPACHLVPLQAALAPASPSSVGSSAGSRQPQEP